MAHIAKYKAPSVGHMLAHYRRDRSSLERDNIDPERIKNDLVVGHYTNKDGKLVVGRVEPREGEPNWGTVESRIERVNEAQKAAGKRATRKDAVVMADVVVTLPDNVRKLDKGVAARVFDELDEIAKLEDPRSRGKALTGNLAGVWRYRVGDYRILCDINDGRLVILVVDVAHRREVYKRR